MSRWQQVPLGNLVESVQTWSPADDAPDRVFRYIDLSAVDQETKTITAARAILGADAPSRARQLARKGDVLVSTVRPNLNAVARVFGDLDGATASTGFCVLRPNTSVLDGGYLFHWVRTNTFVADMSRRATGASYPAVSDSVVCGSTLPLPPLAEQRRIAAVLDKADELRAKRKAALAELDGLAQSAFVEMFGDPIAKPNRWALRGLAQLGRVTTGTTPPSVKSGMFGGSIPFVTPGDLETQEPPKRTVTEAGASESRVVRSGASLVCCIGATIGKMGRASSRSAFNQQINAVEWGGDIDDEYGLATLRFFKPLIVQLGASTTLPILKKSSFEKLQIPVPPLAMQRRFAERIRCMDAVGRTERQSSMHLRFLFESLQHRAFRGEL